MRTSIFLPLVAPRDTILLIGAQGATHFLLEKNLRSGPSRHLSILGDPFWYLINATVTHSSLSFCLSLFQSALSIMTCRKCESAQHLLCSEVSSARVQVFCTCVQVCCGCMACRHRESDKQNLHAIFLSRWQSLFLSLSLPPIFFLSNKSLHMKI